MASARELHHFYSELHSLLRAGFPIEKAAEAIQRHRIHSGTRPILAALKSGLQQGLTISESLRQGLNPLDHALLDASERGGRLEEGCQHLASYYGMIAETKKKTLAGLVYPLFLLHLTPLPTVAPKLLSQGLGATALAYLQSMLWIYGLVGAVILLIRAAWATPGGRQMIESLVAPLPVIGSWLKSFALGRFSKVFEICLRTGCRVDHSLELASEASQSPLLKKAVLPLLAQVQQREELGPALLTSAYFPSPMSSGFAVAEQAGTMDSESSRWATYFMEQTRLVTEQISAWVPRIIYVVVACYVGYTIISFYQGYFGQFKNILDPGLGR